MKDIVRDIAVKCDDLDNLIDMVMDRDAGEALELVTMLHEIAKLYVADQMPVPDKIIECGFATDETLEILFSGRNVRTAKNLLTHLKLQVDDDGIPI